MSEAAGVHGIPPGGGLRAPVRRPLTVIVGTHRHDVVVDENLPVGEVLGLLAPEAPLEVLTATGRSLLGAQTVAQARLAPGTVLLAAPPGAATDLGSAPRGPVPPRPAPDRPRASADPSPAAPLPLTGAIAPGGGSSRAAMAAVASAWTPPRPPATPAAAPGPDTPRRYAALGGALAAAALAGLAATTVLAGLGNIEAAPGGVGWWRWGIAAVLVLGGLVVVQLGRPGDPAGHLARHLAPLLGAAGGAVGAALAAGTAPVAVIGGCGGAALVALAGPVEGGPTRRLPWMWALGAAAVGLVALWALAVGAPATAIAALLLAAVALVPRVLPLAVIDVEPGVLLDLDRLSVTSWSPRERRGRQPARRRIDTEQVRRLVVESATTQTAVLGGCAALGAGCALALGLAARHTDAAGGAATALLLVAAAVAPALAARAYRQRIDRFVLRLSALAPGCALVLPWAVRADGAVAVVGASAALVLGLVVAAGSAAAGASRSLTGARLADALEGLALLGVVPAALWAAGVLDWVRGLLA